jgi:hypothetical protein
MESSDMSNETRTADGMRRRGRRLARLMRMVNAPMRVVLSAPFPTPLAGRLMLAYLTGRRSGRHYRQPLSYVRDGSVLLTPGGGGWTANLLDGRPVLLRLRGRDVTAIPELVRDPAQVEALLDTIATANPAAGRFVPLPRTPDGKLEPVALAQAIGHGFGIVRWHLTPAAA